MWLRDWLSVLLVLRAITRKVDAMASVLDVVRTAVNDLQASSSEMADAVIAGVNELKRLGEKLAAGNVGPTEAKEISDKIVAVASATKDAAAQIKTAVDEPDPDEDDGEPDPEPEPTPV